MIRKLAGVIVAAILLSCQFGQAQLMNNDRETAFKATLPIGRVPPHVQQILTDPETLFYTEHEMLLAYQFVNPRYFNRSPGGNQYHTNIFWVEDNISGDAREAAKGDGAGGNGGVEFPWRQPGGLHLVPNMHEKTNTFRMLNLPRDSQGNKWPVVIYQRQLTSPFSATGRHKFNGFGWIFPAGASLAESLMVVHRGRSFTFNLRLRHRLIDQWEPEILVPFPNYETLVSTIKEYRPDWEKDSKINNIIKQLESPKTLQNFVLTDENHPQPAIRLTAALDYLPEMPEDLVAELLLKKDFEDAREDYWRESNGNIAYAPTAPSANFNIVPEGYLGTFLGTSQRSCMNCHDGTSRHVGYFHLGRDWYGHIPGSDGIFTFNPFDPSCVSKNGSHLPVRLNQTLLERGYIAWYDPAKHPPEVYGVIRELQVKK